MEKVRNSFLTVINLLGSGRMSRCMAQAYGSILKNRLKDKVNGKMEKGRVGWGRRSRLTFHYLVILKVDHHHQIGNYE